MYRGGQGGYDRRDVYFGVMNDETLCLWRQMKPCVFYSHRGLYLIQRFETNAYYYYYIHPYPKCNRLKMSYLNVCCAFQTSIPMNRKVKKKRQMTLDLSMRDIFFA